MQSRKNVLELRRSCLRIKTVCVLKNGVKKAVLKSYPPLFKEAESIGLILDSVLASLPPSRPGTSLSSSGDS